MSRSPLHKPVPIDVPEQDVFYEQALLLFRAAPTSVGGTFLGILFVVLILWGVTDHEHLYWWAGSFIALNTLRAIHAVYFQSHRDDIDMVVWSRQFGAGAIAAGAMWGSTALFLFPAGDPVHQVMLFVLLSVACTVGITNISMIRYIIFAFIILALTPLVFRFFTSPAELMDLLGVMTLVAMGLFLVGGNRVYLITEENIRHRLEATESERQLRHSQQRLAMHIQRTPLGVIEWSPGFKVTHWNHSAEKIFGYSANEAIGKSGIDLIVPDELKQNVQNIVNQLSAEQGGTYSINENITKDGRTILCEWFNTTLVDDNGKVIGMASLVNDVTDRVRAERLKNEFISTVSHELRTPLTSLRGSLGLILGGITGKLTDKTRELVQMADNNASRLHNLIDDILDMQKIESGLMKFDFVDIDILPVVQQAVSENQGYAQQVNVHLALTSNARNLRAHADAKRILQVLDNLISNAIKFSPENGKVEVIVQRSADRIRVSVSDEGPGISEEFLPKLFEKFTQEDSSTSRSFAGTGLGLSIAKGIIESHHGHLGYEPMTPSGSRFYFELDAI